MRTSVGIIGAGPAGLVLSHLLHLHGIESVIIESRSREYVEGRVRAGVLDNDVAELFKAVGVGDRMEREGIPQEKMEFRFNGERRIMNWTEIAGGRRNIVYGQQEVVRDFIERRLADGGDIIFDAQAEHIEGATTDRPRIRFQQDGQEKVLECDLIAGCDGYHGVARASIPNAHITEYERQYPYAWVGILADVPPSNPWLVSASHDRGFALLSMRSDNVTRAYVQVDRDDSIDMWPAERVWEELHLRLATPGWELKEGPVTERSKIDLRSFVCEPMRFGSLFLAGDAAHVVPPTGGRGLNQAVADVCVLADAFRDYLLKDDHEGLDRYSDECLDRVWRAQQFTNRMSSMLQRQDYTDTYIRKLQLTEIDLVTTSRVAALGLAVNYVGEPLNSSFLPDNDRVLHVALT